MSEETLAGDCANGYVLVRTFTATDACGNSTEATQTIEVSNAWRCQWNVTGTVLACSGDRGAVKMYKSDFKGNFLLVSNIEGDVNQAS